MASFLYPEKGFQSVWQIRDGKEHLILENEPKQQDSKPKNGKIKIGVAAKGETIKGIKTIFDSTKQRIQSAKNGRNW